MKLNGDKLNIAMARTAKTSAQLAAEYGVSHQRFRMILNQREVSRVTAGKLAKVLGCDVTEILED